MVKFLQMLVLDFPYIFFAIFIVPWQEEKFLETNV